MKNFWKNKKVLVTGATGLVGYWLTKRLIESGSQVVTLIRDYDPQSELIRSNDVNKVFVVKGSLEDISSLKRAVIQHEVEIIFHLGAQTIVGTALKDPLNTFEANIRGTYNLLEVCRENKEQIETFLIASSDKAYGDHDKLPYKEDYALQGRHPYDVSKSCADLLAMTYFHSYNIPVVVARCGNIFGGGDLNWSRIIPGTIRSFYQGEAPIIRSDGTFIRDYLFVDDAVSAYMAMAENSSKVAGESFNFGPNKPVSVLEIVSMIQKIMGVSIDPKILAIAKAEIHSQYLDSQKAEKMLNWRPVFSLEEGLKKTINWYVKYLEKNEVYKNRIERCLLNSVGAKK
jgi:CDP-glucose 4,6-dehydratase